ncbi:MAG: bestrophin family ion channel [Gemmataceae bacterium]
MDVCGACERIKTSPIPLSYRSLLRHGLLLYLLSTPWLIADQLGWATVPVMTLMTYFLLGIELTAEEVEEPFGRDGDDLALAGTATPSGRRPSRRSAGAMALRRVR